MNTYEIGETVYLIGTSDVKKTKGKIINIDKKEVDILIKSGQSSIYIPTNISNIKKIN